MNDLCKCRYFAITQRLGVSTKQILLKTNVSYHCGEEAKKQKKDMYICSSGVVFRTNLKNV